MFGSKKQHTDIKIIETSEIIDNHDYEIIETIYSDEVKRVPYGNTFKEYVLRIPKFLVGLKRDDHIKKLKDEVRIGEGNFPEYERVKEEIATKENEIKRVNEDMKPLREEIKDARERLLYLKRHLGSDAFTNLMNQYGRTKSKAKEESGKPQAVARG